MSSVSRFPLGRAALLLLVLWEGLYAPTLSAAPMKHPTNYDESKVGQYTLPDLLTRENGAKVTTAEDWNRYRRAELIRVYEREVFGRVPVTAPFVHTEVVADNEPVENGLGVRRHVILRFGEKPNAPFADLVIYFPAFAKPTAGTPSSASAAVPSSAVPRPSSVVSPPSSGAAAAPAPALLQIVFLKGLPTAGPTAEVPGSAARRVGFPEKFTEIGPVAEILRRGFAYATFKYTDVQPDDADTLNHGVIAASANGAAVSSRPEPASGELVESVERSPRPSSSGDSASNGAAVSPPRPSPRTPDAWGTISAWAWAASRVLDYLCTEPAIDAKRVGLIGHSRLGKTALWASAQDPRFSLVFASCSGEIGAALSRRDYGETIDDIASVFPWWFCGNFQKYIGHWNDLPVDAHSLIALSAPRPVFLTAGTEDQWADPKGEFLAALATEPVYQLFDLHAIAGDSAPSAAVRPPASARPTAGEPSSDSPNLRTAAFAAPSSDVRPPSSDLAPDHPLLDGQIGWLYHAGPHAITDLDWRTFLAFAEKHLQPR